MKVKEENPGGRQGAKEPGEPGVPMHMTVLDAPMTIHLHNLSNRAKLLEQRVLPLAWGTVQWKGSTEHGRGPGFHPQYYKNIEPTNNAKHHGGQSSCFTLTNKAREGRG
jgi:hypothetical protein